MYRQVKVYPEDADFQRIIWRDQNRPNSELQHFRLLRVTFGTAPAPHLAVKALQQTAIDAGDAFPMASERVLRDFYMDDLLTGCQNINEGKEIYKQMTKLLEGGGFQLQKWCSDNEDLLKEINNGNSHSENLDLMSKLSTIKILGLTWNRCSNVFEYSVQLPSLSEPITKRKVISDIAKLYDPLGWIAPVIITAKIFIQKLWISGIGWDDELPPHLLQEWVDYRNRLPLLTRILIPRWINKKSDAISFELHGFSDASHAAYAAAVYTRVVDRNGNVFVNLITSKTRVAPVKQVSIPRLELCGAVLLTRLLVEVSATLEISKNNIHAWTDSSVVLAWLSSHPSRWKTFVANRVSEILTTLDRQQWSHVQSKDNPADMASRGIKYIDWKENDLWRIGPPWLRAKHLPYERDQIDDTSLEEKPLKTFYVPFEQFELWSRYSSLTRLLRIVALCRRFINLIKPNKPKFQAWITAKELNEALRVCIRQCQYQHFVEEIEVLKGRGQVNRKSQLTSLNPFVDKDGILRVGGRLQNSELDEGMKHPILIPYKSHLTDLLIADAHEKTLHGGPQVMTNYLRAKFWIIKIKNLVKYYVRKCVICTRYAARQGHQLMGQLPAARVTARRPFHQSGVDYAGPINIRTTKGRGHHAYKGYICLFVCMATRAIHLEAVSDLTAQGFLSAFKRFVARRGHCAELWSDNGTNFVGAARELKTLFHEERATITREIANTLANNGTAWHFIPPRAPNFGGLWEAGIRSTKHHLKRVISDTTLTFEELSTVLCQVEACLNSRPILQISNNPDDPIPLTPGHFLIGEPLTLAPDLNYELTDITHLKRWQLLQRMVQDFWRRWSREYLTQFLHRYKWAHKIPEPNEGDVVLVKEDDLPPARWLLGIVVKKHPGSDNITRVVSLKCKGAIIKRPVSKLCILPVCN